MLCRASMGILVRMVVRQLLLLDFLQANDETIFAMLGIVLVCICVSAKVGIVYQGCFVVVG